jgi:hypothetical protein
VGIPRLTAEQEQILARGSSDGEMSEPKTVASFEQTGESACGRYHFVTEQQGLQHSGTLQTVSVRRRMTYQTTVRQYQRSLELQRKVLAQLGRLTKLRVLSLGHSVEKPPRPFPKSLELTLKSGLDQLAGLKNLRVLGIQDIDHRMTSREIQWTTLHWPRFVTLKGSTCRSRTHSASYEDQLQ